ncbi:MAG: serine hydrolase [Halolamina sp.]
MPPVSLDDELRRRIDAFCRGVLDAEPIPGLSVAVVDGAGLSHAAGYGSRDVAGGRPATPATLYGVGQCSKPVTAVAVLQLVDGGLLSLSEPVGDRLPISLGDDEPVRVRHLLEHTSGLPRLGVGETLLARELRLSGTGPPLGDREDFYAYVDDADAERVAPPGERFAAGAVDYVLLGELIESVTGRSFAEYVQEHVFAPLEMERATFDERAFARDDDHMTQYLLDEGEPTAASLPMAELTRPAAGVLAPVEELAAFVRLHLGDGAAEGERLLSAETLVPAHEARVDAPGGAYGFGLRRRTVAGETLVGHTGDVAVAGGYLGFLPDAGCGLVVACNAAPSFSLAQVGAAVAAILLGEEPADVVPFWRRRRRRRGLVGEYAAYRGRRQAVVRPDGDALRLRLVGPLGQSTTVLIAPGEGDDGGELRKVGDEAARSDREQVTYLAPGPDGEHRPVEFRVADGPTTLLYDGWRLERVSPTPPEPPSE